MPRFQIGEVVDGANGIGERPTVAAQKLSGDHGHRPVYASHTTCISALATDGARNMGAVSIPAGIVDCVVVIDKIPAVTVVDIAVAVVIHPVTGNFVGIDPDVAGQIRMVDLNALVNHPHHNAAGTRNVAVPRPLCRTTELIGGSRRPHCRR